MGCPNLLNGDLGWARNLCQQPWGSVHVPIGELASVETTLLSMPSPGQVGIAPTPAPLVRASGTTSLSPPWLYSSLSFPYFWLLYNLLLFGCINPVRLALTSFWWVPCPISWWHEVCSHSEGSSGMSPPTCPCLYLTLWQLLGSTCFFLNLLASPQILLNSSQHKDNGF